MKKTLANISHRSLTTALLLVMLSISNMANAGSAGAQKHEYRVVKVMDGDTFIASDGNITFHVRIAAMDAPEKDQV